jgi:HNH endonuclease
MKTLAERFWSKVDKRGPDDCWLWIAHKLPTGYGTMSMPHGQQNGRSNRLAWELAFGPIPDGLHALHNCPSGDNPSCCNPAHLWLGTHKQNMEDCANKGRWNGLRGEKHPKAKLTNHLVRKIRRSVKAGLATSAGLAKALKMDRSTILDIIHGRTWRHVPC